MAAGEYVSVSSQSDTEQADLSRERREVVAALAGALLVDTHDHLRAAWRKLATRTPVPSTLADFGSPPIGEAEALKLAQSEWKQPAVRNRKKIEWQTWAENKYRRFALN